MDKKFIFTVDDNIRFLQEIEKENTPSLFSHPYAALLFRLHKKYGVKIQLNLFYQMPDFNLSMVGDKYKREWEENADWLKLSFHSKEENVCPYENSSYQEVYRDCHAVHSQILRFAGSKSLAKTTTVHYCKTTNAGVNALKANGLRGILGLYGTKHEPRTSYDSTKEEGELIRKGEAVFREEMSYAGIDIVLNCFSVEENIRQLKSLVGRKAIRIMIHEQYFYPDYKAYQPDFEDKLCSAFEFLISNGYESVFFEDII